MSDTSSTSTTNPSPTNSPGSSSQAGQGQSSSLYLFTFLATLLLLLAVSCAIVIRSFILRRRFRRRIEEALAAGVLIPGSLEDGSLGRGRRRDFGEKPKLWEVWVDEQGQVHDAAHEGGSESGYLGKGEGRWEGILPVSATILSSSAPNSTSESTERNGALSQRQQHARRLFITRLFGRRPPPSPSPPPTQSPSTQQNMSSTEIISEVTNNPTSDMSKDRPENDRLQVSVLISMPNPNARRTYGSELGGSGSDVSMKGKGKGPGFEDTDVDGEAEIPDVVFGVAEVGFRA